MILFLLQRKESGLNELRFQHLPQMTVRDASHQSQSEAILHYLGRLVYTFALSALHERVSVCFEDRIGIAAYFG